MKKLVKIDERGFIESTQNWPDDKPAPAGYHLKPFLDDLVECGELADTEWKRTDTAAVAEQVRPRDAEKATDLMDQLADI